ncbi:MAG: hypothetical protein KBS89_05135 [Bacteroidales bacterium]|nr:hypothetical protein [Candidatus Egerieousia equi]
MTIDKIFNETELTIFYRQTKFTFGDFVKTSDGTICAIDKEAGLVFIGSDLRRSNVHSLDSVASVNIDEKQAITISFNGLSPVEINAEGCSEAEAFVSELKWFVESRMKDVPGDEVQDAGEAEQQEAEQIEDEQFETRSQESDEPQECTCPQLSNEELSETYARLANTGRDGAVSYLVKAIGISVNEAEEFVDKLEYKDELIESGSEFDYNRDGSMAEHTILSIVKELKAGDKVHIEYKPLLGKLRIYDAEVREIKIKVWERDFSLDISADDYSSMMDELACKLFPHMKLEIYCKETDNYKDCKLERIKILKKL